MSGINPTEIGAQVVKQLVVDTKLDVNKLDEVLVGNILPAGLGQGPGRQVAIKAGIPEAIPGYSINIACGSGMKAVMNSYAHIQAGLHNLTIAGGIESMSQAPFLVNANNRLGSKMGNQTLVDHMLLDALTDAYGGFHMGITAENIAAKHGLTREAQDEFAISSQLKAIAADDAGKFKDEIVPIVIAGRKGDVIVDKDEYINRKTDLAKLSSLRPAFKKDGTVTAGNASGINDGASFVVVASEDAVKEQGLKPLVEVIGIGQGGVAPEVMGLGPVPAVTNALKHAGLDIKDVDLFELNEAFAAQSLGVVAELSEIHGVSKEWILERTNVNGGAIALGHPVGASGNRIIVTLIHELLKRKDAKVGVASLCIGGGMGTAIVVRKV